MNILIAGDLVPTKSNINLFSDGNIEGLLGEELFKIWESADIKIFNLETPIVDEKKTIKKYGPNLIAPTSTINGIKKLRPSLLTLANNHILDQGQEGLESTKYYLSENDINYIGVGDNIYDAIKYNIIQKNNKKIGVYNCTEYEFSIASENEGGANPFDPLESIDHIRSLKEKADYVIVIYHGGKEHYRYPSPYLQKVCRKMVDSGADIVVCQHSHCIGCLEQYNESTIIYGQGNFIFDANESEYWKTSLIVDIKFEDKIKINYIPIQKVNNCIRLSENKEAEIILKEFYKRSKEILEPGFIEETYKKFAEESIISYLRIFSGNNKWLNRIDKYIFLGKLLKRRYNEEKLLAIRNFIECEAHRELIIKGIKV